MSGEAGQNFKPKHIMEQMTEISWWLRAHFFSFSNTRKYIAKRCGYFLKNHNLKTKEPFMILGMAVT